MNNATIFAQHPTNFQFLSVCHYITTFGVILSNYGLILPEDQDHSPVVLNALLEYLHNSKNESEAKLQLLQQVLRGSDLYGGGENDTLDMIYVEETYQYIISNALFSNFGHIEGYLAVIINRADNINYFSLKEKVFESLSENYASMSCCSSSSKGLRLTPVAAKKVFNDHIWPMFPEPEEDISIIDVNYIYAMVGLKIVRSLGGDTSKSSLEDYILIAREFDFTQDNSKQTYQMAIALFSTPALFFYSYSEKTSFQINYQNLQSSNELWIEIYKNFFSYLNSRFDEIKRQIYDEYLQSKFEEDMRKTKNRTSLATSIIRSCSHMDERWMPDYVNYYMTHNDIVILGCTFPNLNEAYYDQFTSLEKSYNNLIKNIINKTLSDNNLIEILNRKCTVKIATIERYCEWTYPYEGCHYDFRSNSEPSIKMDIYLFFAIIYENNNTDYYAFRKDTTGLSVHVERTNETAFADKVFNNITRIMKKSKTILKYSNEDYKEFINRLANIKTDEFISYVKFFYYNLTAKEIFIEILKSLVPFYNCIEAIRDNRVEDAVFSCSLDALSLVPVAGQVGKYAAKLSHTLAVELGIRYLSVKTLTSLTIKNIPALLQVTKAFSKTVLKEIVTKNFLYDSSVTLLRVVDPGCELILSLNKFSFKMLQKMYRNMYNDLIKTSVKGEILTILKSMLKNQENNLKLVPQYMGLVPNVLSKKNNFEVVRFLHPAGSHEFGPTCVSSFGKIAELRTVEESLFKNPVVQEKLADGTISYRPYNLESGKIEDINLKMQENGLLRPYNYYIELGEYDWKNTKYTREYNVYPLRPFWKKRPINTNPNAEWDTLDALSHNPSRSNQNAYVRNDLARRPLPDIPDASSTSNGNRPSGVSIRRPLRPPLADTNAPSTSRRDPDRMNFDERQLSVDSDAPSTSNRNRPTGVISGSTELIRSPLRPPPDNSDVFNTPRQIQRTGNIFIDDVLIHNELYQVKDMNSALERIQYMFDDTYRQPILPVFKWYQDFPEIRHYMIFEDYYLLYSYRRQTLLKDINLFKRTQTSTYRLALQQSGDEFHETLILYSFIYVPEKIFDKVMWSQEEVDKFIYVIPFYTKEEFIKLKSPWNAEPSTKILVLKLNIMDQTGIVDMSRVPGLGQEHIALKEVRLKFHGIGSETIGDKSFDVLNLHDLETLSANERKANMADTLGNLLSANDKSYKPFPNIETSP